MSPLSNAMVPLKDADKGEMFYPLHAYVCKVCYLVQLGEFETPEAIFAQDYTYFSSYSRSWIDHAKSYVSKMDKLLGFTNDAHIVEVASNDGYLLQWFIKLGRKVTGVEPAQNCAQAAIKAGVPTICEFFGVETARAISADRGKADLLVANNVLAHVPNLQDFVGGFQEILNPDGVITFEFPHLLNLIRYRQFDTIYHEHFSYLSLSPVKRVLENHGLRVFDVEELQTHGGSLRVFACKENAMHAVTPAVENLISREKDAGLYDTSVYSRLTGEVEDIKCNSLDFLIKARREGKSVAAYGAAAKGTTFLNYCGIGPELIEFAVDRNPVKQNQFMPGVRIPVYTVEYLLDRNPDYVVILPWNLTAEVAGQLRKDGLTSSIVTFIPELVQHS